MAQPAEQTGRGADDRLIPLHSPATVERELDYIAEAIAHKHLSGNGRFTERCQASIEEWLGAGRAFLTPSGTAALEMAAILLDIRPGDEIIMPSWTFPSTANAFVLRGGTPVFVDVRPDTLNLDESLIENAITPRTRAICVVHYAGVGANVEAICEIAIRRGLKVVEDAALAIFARRNGRPLGSFGHLAAFSFHDTKPVTSGEGGALVVHDPAIAARAEIVWEKGTDRVRFKRGEVSSYSWMDVGSSFVQSEILAAFLYAQLQQGRALIDRRLRLWNRYYQAFEEIEARGVAERPGCPGAEHNASLFYLLIAEAARRAEILAQLREAGIGAATHYVPLHGTPAGRRFGRLGSTMTSTDDVARRLIRLPLHASLGTADQETVIAATRRAFQNA